VLKARQKTITVFLSLALFFCLNLSFAEPPPDKRVETRGKGASVTQPQTVTPPPRLNPPSAMVGIVPLRIRFRVNPPVRFRNSPILVLAGAKDKGSPIYVNSQIAVTQNAFTSWYFEYPLPQNEKDAVISVSQTNPQLKLRGSQIYSFSLKSITSLAVEPPRISAIRVDPATKDIILTIQDPTGVLSYNIYYANSLNSSPAALSFILAQSNVSVSGTGITTWRDNGTYTGKPPLDPTIKMRFYRLEVAQVDPNCFQFALLTPTDNSTFLAGAKVNIQADIVNPDFDLLQYRFSIGGTIAQDWSGSNTCFWQTSSSDTGTASITCEVKDTKARQISKTISCRIINPTVEEILQKVADNYALIDDKQMDVTMNSKFAAETQAFGETVYTRHYFKKPDKQKTETFESAQRSDSAKTEIHIVNGPDTYLIDPKTNARSQGNILTDSNLTSAQLNQMDEIYHLLDFFNAHFIVRIDNPDDLSKGLVILEATPKTVNNFYSKLGMQIDYFKGLKVKSLTYLKENNQHKLKETLETTASTRLDNAWVPTKQLKTLYLSEGNLVMTYNFENIRINTNLSDSLFDPERQ
jgi:outer membrane lipoprotein-sorting protein